jgi:hypothetical protein
LFPTLSSPRQTYPLPLIAKLVGAYLPAPGKFAIAVHAFVVGSYSQKSLRYVPFDD